MREKLDALMIEFFQFAREISALRAKTRDLLSQTYTRFIEAQMLMGFGRMEETSISVQDRFEVEASTRNVIGVSIPYAQVKVLPLEGYSYSMIGTSAKLDEAVALMAEAVKNVAELSAAEAAIRRLAEAIAATKRRVNSLEYIVVPRIQNTIRYIEMSLQERHCSSFPSLRSKRPWKPFRSHVRASQVRRVPRSDFVPSSVKTSISFHYIARPINGFLSTLEPKRSP